uniref:Protein unc-80 n=1 Tax=Sphaerodactylus townsendi TaxID=933632 RepID=A0ACB8G0C9_9SAUR
MYTPAVGTVLFIFNRVASVQSEPGHHNLLLQQPLGRKRGLRQLRRPLLSRQKTQTEPRSRHGARLSTTRRSIQPKSKPAVDQKRSVTFTEAQSEASSSMPDQALIAAQQQSAKRGSPADGKKQEATSKPVLTSSPAIIVADLHSQATTSQGDALSLEKDKKKEDEPETRLIPAPGSPPPSQLSDTEDFTGLETTSLLEHGDTILHISEDNGMENPQFTLTHVEVGQTDVGLDESHV